MNFIMDENGKYKRVWLEMPAIERNDVKNLQKGIAEINKDFEPYEEEKLHLTLFHFGKPKEIYDEFCLASGEDISFDEFKEVFSDILRSFEGLVEKNVIFEVKNVELFGREKFPKVVLIIDKNGYVENKRNKISVALAELLHKFKIPDTYRFIKYSKNFRYSSNKEYTPHITLGVYKNKAKNFVFVKPDFSSVVLGPSRIANFTEPNEPAD
jgi:2'-5' RNA ligase